MLTWLIGTSVVSAVIAVIGDQILKALSNEVTILTHNTRGGIFGVVWGVSTGTLGMPGVRRSVSEWRKKVSFAGKEK
tara:strand:+ start:225 stop:455 length:231 start_codon:yes stop_codon:yes gene_type:complete